MFDEGLAPAAEVGDVPTRDPDHVAGASGSHRQVLELGVHHDSLLRSEDGGFYSSGVERLRDLGIRHLDRQRDAVAVGQVVGEPLGPVVGGVRFHAGTNHQFDDLTEMQTASVRACCSFGDESVRAGVHFQLLDGWFMVEALFLTRWELS